MDKIEEKVDEFKGKFRLVHGCIRKNESKLEDISLPEYFGSIEEARIRLKEHADFYEKVGYKVWYGSITIWDETEKRYK